MTVNNVYGVMKAVQSGAGVGALPEFMAASNPDLVQVLPELTGPQLDAYFVYAEEMRRSKRISVFRDFLLRKVAEDRKSAVWGQRLSVRVDLGGRRIIKQTTNKTLK